MVHARVLIGIGWSITSRHLECEQCSNSDYPARKGSASEPPAPVTALLKADIGKHATSLLWQVGTNPFVDGVRRHFATQ
jgi:hypothetical protein